MQGTNFDRVAHLYRWMEYLTFGPFLRRCRIAQLEQLGAARRALVLGDGDGRFLAHLLASNPQLNADVIDSSRSMLDLLDRRVIRVGGVARRRIRLHHQDALRWAGAGKYDLVISHFFLDCFFPHQMEELLDRLIPRLAPGAQWVVSEFSIPSRPPISYLSAATVGLLYRSFGLLTGLRVRRLPDYAASMTRRGLLLAGHKTFLRGLLESQLWYFPVRTALREDSVPDSGIVTIR